MEIRTTRKRGLGAALSLVTLLSFTSTGRAESYLERVWIDRRKVLADDQWPMTPPENFVEEATIFGKAEAVWDQRWRQLDRQFAIAMRVALALARDGHEGAARAELPMLVRTLGLINAHSRKPKGNRRDARDHALELLIERRIAQAIQRLGAIDPEGGARIERFLNELVAAVASSDDLARATTPLLTAQRTRAWWDNTVAISSAASVGSVGSFGVPLLFSATPSIAVILTVTAATSGAAAYVLRHHIPKRYEPDDQNRVGPVVKRACDQALVELARRSPPEESKTSHEDL